jgi:hypothetical protein
VDVDYGGNRARRGADLLGGVQMTDPAAQQKVKELVTLVMAAPDLAPSLLKTAKAMRETPYGDVVIKMHQGKPEFVEVVNKKRMS